MFNLTFTDALHITRQILNILTALYLPYRFKLIDVNFIGNIWWVQKNCLPLHRFSEISGCSSVG